jgi:hypothetical protein
MRGAVGVVSIVNEQAMRDWESTHSRRGMPIDLTPLAYQNLGGLYIPPVGKMIPFVNHHLNANHLHHTFVQGGMRGYFLDTRSDISPYPTTTPPHLTPSS